MQKPASIQPRTSRPKFHEIRWNSMKFNEILIKFHLISSNFIELYWILLNFIEFHLILTKFSFWSGPLHAGVTPGPGVGREIAGPRNLEPAQVHEWKMAKLPPTERKTDVYNLYWAFKGAFMHGPIQGNLRGGKNFLKIRLFFEV